MVSTKQETLEQEISEQTPVIRVNKSELKLYSNDGKTPAKGHHEKAQLE